MTDDKLEFDVAISAMNVDELLTIIVSPETKKSNFCKAITLFIKQEPKEFDYKLKTIIENPDQDLKVRSKIVFYLLEKGYVGKDYTDYLEHLKQE